MRKYLHTDIVRDVTADTHHIVSGSDDCTVRVWPLSERAAAKADTSLGASKALCEFPHGDKVWAVTVSKDLVASGSFDRNHRC